MKTRLVNPQAIRFSLGWKTTAMVLLPILLGTLATAWLLLAILEQENRMSVRQLMNQEMLVLDRELAFMEKEVERLAVNPVLINALANPDMLQGTLPELLGRFSQGMRIRSFVLTDPVGASVFAHGDPLPQYKELPNLKEALATGKAISHLDLTKKMVLVAAPVHYFNNIQGVIVSGFDVGAIMNRLISEGGQRRMVVGNQKLDVGRVAKGDKWESLAASSQTPMLYRLGVSVDAAVEELRIGTIILKSVAFVCLMGVGITLAVWFLMSRAVSRAGETILNTVGTGRAGRVRGLATAPAAVRKGGGEPVKTENVATESPPEDLENRLGDRNQEIENSRQWLRYVIDAVADRLFWKDREGVYRGCNRAFAQDAGLANVADVENLRETDMPWQEMVAQFLEFEQTVMEENRPMTPREGMIRTRSGIDLKIYFDRIPVKNGAGDIIGVLGVYQLAEQEGPGMEQRLLEYDTLLQSMFHVMEEGLWEWDLISGEMVFNSRWWEMLGIDGDSVEIDREAWRRRVHPGDWSEVEGLVERHLSGVTMVYESEHRIRHQDGHWLWVLERGRISQWKNDG
ncbi:MAG TPA: PAS domain-containing protein, partial [Magnetococcales bacterium]|nr:PAS domain-containing protein [Magnetococcales bacterium]